MAIVARLQRVNQGMHFRAQGLRAVDPALIDPFLAVDHAWISAPTFPPHGHAGFSTVSYLFLNSETGILSRDSLGNRNVILPGGVQWTTAGRGITHEEIPAEQGKTAHLLQIFVNLVREQQTCAPFTLNVLPQDVPVVHLPGARIRVPLGRHAQAQSPLASVSDIDLLDISLDDDSEISIPIPARRVVFVMPVFGVVTVDSQRFHCCDLGVPILPAIDQERTVSYRPRSSKWAMPRVSICNSRTAAASAMRN